MNAFVQSEISDYRANIHTFLNTLISPLDANSHIVHTGSDQISPHVDVNCHVLPSGIDQIWDITGGYDHPQPGSRLLQYGKGNPLNPRYRTGKI